MQYYLGVEKRDKLDSLARLDMLVVLMELTVDMMELVDKMGWLGLVEYLEYLELMVYRGWLDRLVGTRGLVLDLQVEILRLKHFVSIKSVKRILLICGVDRVQLFLEWMN